MKIIHSTAVIADTVELGRDVCIGPYCCLDGNVVLGDNCQLDTHVVVTGNTIIGADTRIFPHASYQSARPSIGRWSGHREKLPHRLLGRSANHVRLWHAHGVL